MAIHQSIGGRENMDSHRAVRAITASMPRVAGRGGWRSPCLAAIGCVCAVGIAFGLPGCSGMFENTAAPNEQNTVADRLAEAQQRPDPAPKGSNDARGGNENAGPPIAVVNDRPISQQHLIGLLVEGRGLALLQQMLLREVARQEADRLGLEVAEADVDHEYDLTLRGERFDGKDVEALTPARRTQLVDQWTRTRGIPRIELKIAMQRQACLRKIAQGQVEISDAMLRREYNRVHGEKVEVRHIQLPAKRAYAQIMQRLNQGDRFEDLVLDYSENRLSREKQGLLPAFAADDPTVPAIFAKVAFELEPGQVSNPIEAEGSFHVLKLERRIAADGTPFEQARDELREHLQARIVAERMEEIAKRLFLQARISIEDPTLRAQYNLRRQNKQIEGPPLAG
jgi:foldase protein PrsA